MAEYVTRRGENSRCTVDLLVYNSIGIKYYQLKKRVMGIIVYHFDQVVS